MTAPSFRNWLTTQAAAQPPTQFDNGIGITLTAAALVHRLASQLTEDWSSPDDLHCLLHGSTELGDLACEALEDVRRPWEALVREFGPPLRPLTAATPALPVHDELWRHLDWSFWGTGMADEFREPLAEAMLAGITPEQRQQANDLITRWRDHREFVGRDKYEAQKAEIESLREQLEAADCRLHHIKARVARVTTADDPTGIAGDVGPFLDGPLHPDHYAAYHAARITTAQEG